jgi:preprotein translocase subunit SecE
MKKIRAYLQGVVSEIKKVTFPSKKETWGMTTLVIVLSGIVAVYVGVIDLGFRAFVKWLIAG